MFRAFSKKIRVFNKSCVDPILANEDPLPKIFKIAVVCVAAGFSCRSVMCPKVKRFFRDKLFYYFFIIHVFYMIFRRLMMSDWGKRILLYNRLV